MWGPITALPPLPGIAKRPCSVSRISLTVAPSCPWCQSVEQVADPVFISGHLVHQAFHLLLVAVATAMEQPRSFAFL